MKRAIVSNFLGMAANRLAGNPGEFAFSKHFDVLSYPKMLKPIRGMSTDTASTGIGNIIVGSDGFMYGVGTDPNNPGNGKLYVRNSYGGGSAYATMTPTNQLSGAAVNYDFLVEWPDSGATRSMLWASNNILVASQLETAAAGGTLTQALTFSSIGQGLVHPKDSKLYFPYKTTTTPYIGIIRNNGTLFADYNPTLITLPKMYRAYCLSYYNNFLAVPLANTSGDGAAPNSSEVQLWDLDTALTQPQEVIPWGAGQLKVMNNLGGVLIGISQEGVNSAQDSARIVIRAWNGGPEPEVIKTLTASHLAGSNSPTVAINPRVNFIANRRLYFSINLVPGDGKQTARYGLWSVGKNQAGGWSVVQEIVETNANTGTGVIAAAISSDYVSIVHTTEGTLTYSTNGQTGSAVFGASSVYESVVNPGNMPEEDKLLFKKLATIRVRCLPLPTGAQLTLKYRTDSDGDNANWVTATTAYTTTGGVAFKAITQADGSPFTGGYNFEFQLISTGGATPTAILYEYTVTE